MTIGTARQVLLREKNYLDGGPEVNFHEYVEALDVAIEALGIMDRLEAQKELVGIIDLTDEQVAELQNEMRNGTITPCEKNDPLTLDELRQMNGEPVWIEDEKAWGLVSVDQYGVWENTPFVLFRYRQVDCQYNIETRGLKCYRHKPKEI